MSEALIRQLVRAEVQKLAAECGSPDARIGDDEIIPETGFLDSAAVVQLVVWAETHFSIPLDDDEITVDNLGSITRITKFVADRLSK